MKGKILAIVTATLFCFGSIGFAEASDTAIVNITLNLQTTIGLECNRSVWNPTCGIGGTENTSDTWGLLTNTGNVAFNIEIKGENTTDWILDGSPAHNTFRMSILDGTGTTLSIEYQYLDTLEPMNDGGSPYHKFGLGIEMPTSSSTSAEQHLAVIFTATAL